MNYDFIVWIHCILFTFELSSEEWKGAMQRTRSVVLQVEERASVESLMLVYWMVDKEWAEGQDSRDVVEASGQERKLLNEIRGRHVQALLF